LKRFTPRASRKAIDIATAVIHFIALMPTDAQHDPTAIIRAKLLATELPTAPPAKVWVGKGTGKPCMGCDRPIAPDLIEYELDYPDPAAHKPTITLRFDQRCLAVWHKERARVNGG
jgi:hypothetical protein